MKGFFSRKHNTQPGHSKSTSISKDSNKLTIPPSDSERNTSKPALVTADTHSAARNHADLRTSSRNPKPNGILHRNAAHEKIPTPPKATSITERVIYPSRTNTALQPKNHHPISSQPPPKATGSKHRDSEDVRYYSLPRSPKLTTPSHVPVDRIKNSQLTYFKNESATAPSHERQLPSLLSTLIPPTNGEEQTREQVRSEYVERHRLRHEEKEVPKETVRREPEVARERNRREGERDGNKNTKDRDREEHAAALKRKAEHDKNVQRRRDAEKERILEREQTGEIDHEKDRRRGRDRTKEKEREQEQEQEQERAQKDRDRERQREHDENEKERRDRERLRQEYREKHLERERRDREDYELERLHRERDQEQQVVTLVDNMPNLKREQETGRISEHRKKLQYDRTAVSTRTHGTLPNGGSRNDNAAKDRYHQKERHHELTRIRAEATDGEQDLAQTWKISDHDRRKERKSGWVSDNHTGQESRTSRQLRYAPPAVDDAEDTSDGSINRMTATQRMRNRERKLGRNLPAHTIAPQSRQDHLSPTDLSGNQVQVQVNSVPLNVLPAYATPRIVPLEVSPPVARRSEKPPPQASDIIGSENLKDAEILPVRREINRTKLANREDFGTANATEPRNPLEPPRQLTSRVSIIQGRNSTQVMSSQVQRTDIAPAKQIQSSAPSVQDNGTVGVITEGMHAKVRSEDSNAPAIVLSELPVEKLLGVQSIPVQESGRSRFRSNDGSDLRGAQDPLAESSKGSHFPTVRRTGHLRFWPDRRKERSTPNHGVDQLVASDSHMETPVVSARSDIVEKLPTLNPIMLRQMQTTAVTPPGGGKETNFSSEVGLVSSIVHPPTVKKSGPPPSLPTVGPTSPQIAPPTLSERLNVYSTPAIQNQRSNPTSKIPDMQTHALDDFCEDSQTQEAQQTKVTRSRNSHINHPLPKSNTEEIMLSVENQNPLFDRASPKKSPQTMENLRQSSHRPPTHATPHAFADGSKSVHSHAVITDARYMTPRIQTEELMLGKQHRNDVEIRRNTMLVPEGANSNRYPMAEQVGSIKRPPTTTGQKKDHGHDTRPPIAVSSFGTVGDLNAETDWARAPTTLTIAHSQARIRERVDQEVNLPGHNAPTSNNAKKETDSDMTRTQEPVRSPVGQLRTSSSTRKEVQDPPPNSAKSQSQPSVQESATHGHIGSSTVEPSIGDDHIGNPPTKVLLAEIQAPVHTIAVQEQSGLLTVHPATSAGSKGNVSSTVSNAFLTHNRQVEDVGISRGGPTLSQQTPQNSASPRFSPPLQSHAKSQIANLHKDQSHGVDVTIALHTEPPVVRQLDTTAKSHSPLQGAYAATIAVGPSITHNTDTSYLRPGHRELETSRRAGYDTELVTQPLHMIADFKQVDLVSRQWVPNTPVPNSAILSSGPDSSRKLLRHDSPDSRSRATQLAQSRGSGPSNAYQDSPQLATQVQTTAAVPDPRSLAPAPDSVPQLKIRHPVKEFDQMREAEVSVNASRNLKPPVPAIVPDPAPLASHTKVGANTIHDPSLEQYFRAIESSRKEIGGNRDERRRKDSPDAKSYEIDGVTIVSPWATSLKRVSQDNTDDTNRLMEPLSNEIPRKHATDIGGNAVNRNHGVAHTPLQKTDADLLRSTRPAVQQLPIVSDKIGSVWNFPQTPHPKIHHPVLSELLSSPPPRSIIPDLILSPSAQGTLGYEQRDNGTLANAIGHPDQLQVRDVPQEWSKQELDPKPPNFPREGIQVLGNRAGRRQSNRKSVITVTQTGDFPSNPPHLTESSHQLLATQAVVDGTLHHGSTEQSVQEARDQKNLDLMTYPVQGGREKGFVNRETTSQATNLRGGGGVLKSRNEIPSQPLPQNYFARHQHLASLPTPSMASRHLDQDTPRAATPAIPQLSHTRMRPNPEHAQTPPLPRAPSEETILMTPSSITKSLTLKPTSSRQSNASSVDSKTGKKAGLFSRFIRTSKKTTPEIWHPNSSSKTPESSPGHSKGTTTLHGSTTTLVTAPNTSAQPTPIPVPENPPVASVFTPFKYVTSKKQRSLSLSSMEARDGRALSTVVGSPTASIHSNALPPIRDSRQATHDWLINEEDYAQSRPKGRRPPGVVIVADEDAPEDRQRPRRMATKYRSAGKRKET